MRVSEVDGNDSVPKQGFCCPAKPLKSPASLVFAGLFCFLASKGRYCQLAPAGGIFGGMGVFDWGASPKEQPLECPMPLSDTAIKKAKPGDKPVKLSDGKGLYLRVNPVGSRLLRWTTGVRGCWFARGAWGVGRGGGKWWRRVKRWLERWLDWAARACQFGDPRPASRLWRVG